MRNQSEVKDPVVAKMHPNGTDIFNDNNQVSDIDIHGIVDRKQMQIDPHFKEEVRGGK